MEQLRAFSWYASWIGCLFWIGCGNPVDEPDDPGGGSQVDITTDEPGSGVVVAYDCGAVSAATTVEVEPEAFAPERAVVAEGDIVRWRNRRETAVTVTSGEESNSGTVFDSGDIAPGDTHCFEFRMTGTFHYYGKHHGSDHLSGVVRVQPEWK